MKSNPSIIIVGAEETEQTLLMDQIGDLVNLASSAADPTQAPELTRQHHPDLALLFLDHDPGKIFEACRDIAKLNGCVPMIVSKNRDPQQILQAMKAGAKAFSYLEGESNEIRQTILDLSKQITVAAGKQGPQSKVVAVFSCKGGSGSTTIATNLASALHQHGKQSGKKTVLVDLNFQMGDVLAFLDITSRYTWRNLVDNMHRLDEVLLWDSLTRNAFGLHVISQSDVPEEADNLNAEGIERGIAFLRRYAGYVVIDGLRDFNEISLTALDRADMILLVVTPDIPALKNAKRCLTIFRQLGYDNDKMKLVLNRHERRARLDPDSIGDALEMPVSATVSNDYANVIQSINEGRLLLEIAPRAQVTRDIENLIGLFAEQIAEDEEKFRLSDLWRKRR